MNCLLRTVRVWPVVRALSTDDLPLPGGWVLLLLRALWTLSEVH